MVSRYVVCLTRCVIGKVCLTMTCALASSCVYALGSLPIEGGISDPVFLTAPPGDSRLFVVERAGPSGSSTTVCGRRSWTSARK